LALGNGGRFLREGIMNKDFTAFLLWGICASLSLIIIYFKQGKYFAWGGQIAAIIALGPISLVLAVFCPSSWFTSREKAEGK